MKKSNKKYVFVVGGVMSGVGKGVAAAAIAAILQARGFRVTAVKIDPYVNVDAGTMNPTEHGEVFVLDDGTECDQDLGNYERFLGRDLTRSNYMTTGSIYQSVISKERNLEFGGRCVEVVPHIPLEVIQNIDQAYSKDKADIVITEIGGTVGEYQNVLFLEAVRMLKIRKPESTILILVSYLPLLNDDNELKTKPTQYAVRTLNSAGIQPDVILARARLPLDKKRKEKIAFNCNLKEEDIISAPDVTNLYEIPINFERDKLSTVILGKLNLRPRKSDLIEWKKLSAKVKKARQPVRIGVVGKYFGSGGFVLADSYISVIEAVRHAAVLFGRKPELEWIDAGKFEKDKRYLRELDGYGGVIVPGGFGSRGTAGKIEAIRYLRENKIPFLGLCYGMQLAVVEFSRNVLKLKRADTTEVNPKTSHPVIDVMPEQKKNIEEKNYGGTMRLGAYPAVLKKDTIAWRAYGAKALISERHRHRFEVNPDYIGRLERKGMIFSGISPSRKLMEIMELPQSKHPFFLGTQFHPELKSRPLDPHPLFVEFMRASAKRRNVRK
ncbi:MAG: CTP synthase [Patescibacteria group bacterium]